jgi:hypothetical protein
MNNYPVPVVNHLSLENEMMNLFEDTANNKSHFCQISLKKFMQANYPDDAIKAYFPCLYQALKINKG